MKNEQLKEITSRLDLLINLINMDRIKGKNIKEKVVYLKEAGFSSPTRIAKLIKKPVNTVTATISRLKK